MDKKNTILLTVIAIATLLVAMVGATFAYFTAQTGQKKVVPVNVTTTTSDSSSLGKFGSLTIAANQQNFGETEAGNGTAYQSLRAVTSGYVAFTANSSTGAGDYCYEVELEVTTNDFEYSLPKTFGVQKNGYYPELIFNIWKVSQEGLATEEKLKAEQFSTGEYTEAITVNSTSVPYVDPIITATKVCDTNEDGSVGSSCADNQALKGYDITVLHNSSLVDLEDVKLKDEVSFKIPSTNGGDSFEHKISITGQANGEIDARSKSDYWKATVTFINYSDTNIDGEGKGDQQKNTNKHFNANLKFSPIACAGAGA